MAPMLDTTAGEPDLVQSTYGEWRSWDDQSFGRFSAHENLYYDAEVGSLLRGHRKPRVLEIGFGNGTFLGWGLSRHFECRGIEMIPELLDRAARHGIEAYSSLQDPALVAQRGEFDCVAAFDVMEHIEGRELPAWFRSIAALLRVGGYFVARFPNGDSPFGRPYQHGDLTHVTTVGRLKIEQLCRIAGLRIVSVGEPAHVEAEGMRARLVQSVERRARRVVERVSARLYGFRAPFSPNLVSVLQKPGRTADCGCAAADAWCRVPIWASAQLGGPHSSRGPRASSAPTSSTGCWPRGSRSSAPTA
jgi:SAM-dependent methyltransferase